MSCGTEKRHSNYGYSATDVINHNSDCGTGSYPQPEVEYYINTYSYSLVTKDLIPEKGIDLDLFVFDDCTGMLSICLGKSKKRLAKTVGPNEGILELFPNPFTKKFSISYQPVNGDQYFITILDSAGKIIDTKQMTRGQQDISDLVQKNNKGIYYIQILDGSLIQSERVIKM